MLAIFVTKASKYACNDDNNGELIWGANMIIMGS